MRVDVVSRRRRWRSRPAASCRRPGFPPARATPRSTCAGSWTSPAVRTSPVVTAPNLWGLDPGLLRSAGPRATRSGFNGYAFVPDADDPLRQAGGTNLEIV
jgi:hypothetical protein